MVHSSFKLIVFLVLQFLISIVFAQKWWEEASEVSKDTTYTILWENSQENNEGQSEEYLVFTGSGINTKIDADLDLKRQEAFVSAFFNTLADVFEFTFRFKLEEVEIGKIKRLKGIVSGKIADFELRESVLTNQLNSSCDIICFYNNQKIEIKNALLKAPDVEELDFPNWKDNPDSISIFKIIRAKEKLKQDNILFSVELGIKLKDLEKYSKTNIKVKKKSDNN